METRLNLFGSPVVAKALGHYGAAAPVLIGESTVFTDAERAALELTEQGTRIADGAGGVTDEAWANAAGHYDDDQLAR
jgi:alkylhydroperoxidase family enzyme